jgi:glutamyl-tRNA synthetase
MASLDPSVRVRFAPSPTGKLHIGGARTALFNWAFARHHGGRFVLRIEDTDPQRSTSEYERAILDGLRWLGLAWDEGPDVGGPFGPYRQSERFERYREVARDLVASGHAYRCFCSAERLDALRAEQEASKARQAYDRKCASLSAGEAERRRAAGEPSVVRFRVPAGTTRFVDRIRGEVAFENDEVDDWVMLRTDGTPTYNFCVVCDDVDMRITHVLRGEEHLVNTPKQVLLYQALAQGAPQFAHLPLMLGTDGKKLSKRTGDTALQDYRDQGFPPAAVVNFLCLQGWALDGTTAIFAVDRLIERFDVGDVQKAGAVFDLDKFRWMAGEYIRRETPEDLAAHCAPFVARAGLASEAELARAWFVDVVKLEQPRIHTYAELAPRIAYLFQPDAEVAWSEDAEKGARKQPAAARVLREYADWLAPRLASGVDAAALRDATKAWVADRGLKTVNLFAPLRCALTGLGGGPDVFEIMALLGRDRVVARLERGAQRLAS